MKKLVPGVILATIAILAVIWMIGLGFPAHLYSPGDLCKGHQGIKNCKQCHAPFKGAVSRLCMTDDCHTTERLSQFSSKTLSELHVAFAEKDCLDCHTEHRGFAGKTTKPFDHKILAFNILNECAACHTDDYQKAHPARYTMDCKPCHISTTGWRILSFNHNTVAGKMACVQCHPTPGDKKHRQYPETCETCHTVKNWRKVSFHHDAIASELACTACHKKPDDDLHATASENCNACHSTKKWKPATLDHDKYFPLTGDHSASCNTCHPNGNYQQYTCLNCHEHNTAHIRHEHEEHGIHNYGDCLRCHRMKINGKYYGNPREEFHEEHDEGEGNEDEDDDD